MLIDLRGHVAQDLSPYICIFEDCETAYDLYKSQGEWMAHLKEKHVDTKWVCDLCSGDDEEHFFDSMMEWQAHVSGLHTGSFPMDQIEELGTMSQRHLLRQISCPLCGHFDPSSSDAYEHIALHLHSFALKALPWDTLGEDRNSTVRTKAGAETSGEGRGEDLELLDAEDEAETTPVDIMSLARQTIIVLEASLKDHQRDHAQVMELLEIISGITDEAFKSRDEDEILAYGRRMLEIQAAVRQMNTLDVEVDGPQLDDINQILEEDLDLMKKLRYLTSQKEYERKQEPIPEIERTEATRGITQTEEQPVENQHHRVELRPSVDTVPDQVIEQKPQLEKVLSWEGELDRTSFSASGIVLRRQSEMLDSRRSALQEKLHNLPWIDQKTLDIERSSINHERDNLLGAIHELLALAAWKKADIGAHCYFHSFNSTLSEITLYRLCPNPDSQIENFCKSRSHQTSQICSRNLPETSRDTILSKT